MVASQYSKIGTEQDFWQFDFEKDLLDKANERDDAQLVQELEASIEFWQRVDAARAKA